MRRRAYEPMREADIPDVPYYWLRRPGVRRIMGEALWQKALAEMRELCPEGDVGLQGDTLHSRVVVTPAYTATTSGHTPRT